MTDIFASVRGVQLSPRPWPLADLIDIVGIEPYELAGRIEANWSTFCYCLEHNCTDQQADRWAVRCGFHPSLVWPDWFDYVPEPSLCVSCGTPFTPWPGKRYCTPKCRERQHRAVRRARAAA